METNYRPLPEFLTIKESEIDGLGLFTTARLLEWVYLGVSHIELGEEGVLPIIRTPIIRTPLGGFINHSETPNCIRILEGAFPIWKLYTLRDIEPNEELTLRYTLYNI